MNHQTSDWNESSGSNIRVAYAGTQFKEMISAGLNEGFKIAYNNSIDQLNDYLGEQSILSVPDIILVEVDAEGKWIKMVDEVKQSFLLNGLIIVLLSSQNDKTLRQKAIKLKVHDFYGEPFAISDLRERLNFLVRFKLIKPKLLELSKVVDTAYKMPAGKRLIDLVISGGMMFVLSPVMLIVAILIKLDSKGPVFYKSKRVGTGYKVFDFYKFRSMRTDADQLLAKLSAENNQYAAEGGDNKVAFVKIKNDPRITKLGNFLRNSSLDELPQLFNILRGDMSVVGNRPLPLYEAEMLTSNEWSMRFLGPAGLTGLWQISKRGKEDMSERERKKLDNFYAQKYSIWLDLKIIAGTVPALFQKEKV
ncbi:sugar transferase [Mucilaginibacter sp. cycad4]|uniref:sugar transferase n=1 Tax=Mucilaginibacter sp. cycad4 TaxID=3342096 RepID=UPI002AAA8890|nr:sugar transferase [Mucilaginibacter gossypii]WPV02403.1 sugar transferase [Mucilaginibacter gossypii]